VSAVLVREGVPGRILDAWREHRFDLIVSPKLLGELDEVLTRAKFAERVSPPERSALIELLQDDGDCVDDPPLTQGLTVDPDDDYLAALALSTESTHLVTGDHGLAQWSVPGIAVVSPRQFLDILESSSPNPTG
jgi:putative PIN family toxin of toxin-antitoxin system